MPNVEPLREGDPAAVGPYRLVGRLGAGGHGVVYLGQARNGTPVAVKVLREGLAGGDRLAKEIAAARRVEPFCLAQVLDASTSGRPYIVAEYVDGRSLQESGRLGGAELQRLAVATATALDALHQAGVLHLNLKPANVILGPDGARVVDFGIAGAFGPGMSATSNIVGTPAYMAPEQLAGKAAGAAADVFAWASVVVFAATGVPPFGDDSLPTVINRILRGEPQLRDLRRPLRDVVPACLAKDPAARPAMRDVLLRLIGGEPPEKAPPARRGPARATDDYATPPAHHRDTASAPAAQATPGSQHGAADGLGSHTAPVSQHGAAHTGRTAHRDPAEDDAPYQAPGSRRPSASRQSAPPASSPLAAPVEYAEHPATGRRTAAGEYAGADTHPGVGGHPVHGEGAVREPVGSPMPVERSALVDILVAGEPGTGGKAKTARPWRRRAKAVLIAGVSGVSVLALAAAIVWLTPTTPTPKTASVGGGTGATLSLIHL
ncbi:serine/threonine-protein kinase, partial [Nonomuraea basaltis]|uniref:serine/threonine-protein kinase n=1 Tax=Nonomuraea basaltis TaxID=2495887 RepID=UPI00110C6848